MCFVPQHISLHSFLHLPTPQKTTPTLRLQRRLSAPSLQIVHSFLTHFFPFVLSLPATIVQLAIGSRLLLRQASEQSTSLRSTTLLLASVRFKAALPALFLLRPRQAPDHHPPKKLNNSFITALSGRILNDSGLIPL